MKNLLPPVCHKANWTNKTNKANKTNRTTGGSKFFILHSSFFI